MAVLRLLRTNFLGALSDEEAEAERVAQLRSSLLADPATFTRVRPSRDRLLKVRN